MESPATWTQAEWVVQKALLQALISQEEEAVGLSAARQITDALRQAGLLQTDLPALGLFSPPADEELAQGIEALSALVTPEDHPQDNF